MNTRKKKHNTNMRTFAGGRNEGKTTSFSRNVQ